MSVALYTFGLLDPAAGPDALADFARRGGDILRASDDAPGFLGRADQDDESWGPYVAPVDLPGFAGHDPSLHIATLSLWRDRESAREFVYRGIHGQALKLRYTWFLKGPWPGYVFWEVDDGVRPLWSDGVRELEALGPLGVRGSS